MKNRNFDITNFEQSLKEHADQFLIVPSKRIWHGIYNSLHPGSKWPSFAMGLVFVISLISIGHLNNPELRQAQSVYDNQNNLFVSGNANAHSKVNTNKFTAQLYLPSPFSFWNNNVSGKIKKEEKLQRLIPRIDQVAKESAQADYNSKGVNIQINNKTGFGKYTPASGQNFSTARQAAFLFNQKNTKTRNQTNQESFSTLDLSMPKMEDSKVEWTYFITPSISSGYFPGINTDNPMETNNGLMKNSSSNVIYKNQIGFETGTQIAFKMDEKWQFITGASLMYSGYQMMTNPMNSEGVNLSLQQGDFQNNSVNNYKLQASIPVGVQYEVWENNNVQIKISSTIEPSFLISSDVYSLSPDGKTYVSSPDMLRRVNLSGNLGSYITFGTKNIKWQIGPTIRYHILSNFKNNAGTGGNMFDYGLRIGISK